MGLFKTLKAATHIKAGAKLIQRLQSATPEQIPALKAEGIEFFSTVHTPTYHNEQLTHAQLVAYATAEVDSYLYFTVPPRYLRYAGIEHPELLENDEACNQAVTEAWNRALAAAVDMQQLTGDAQRQATLACATALAQARVMGLVHAETSFSEPVLDYPDFDAKVAAMVEEFKSGGKLKQLSFVGFVQGANKAYRKANGNKVTLRPQPFSVRKPETDPGRSV